MTGKIWFQEHITRRDLQTNPDTLYVFGDNMRRRGMGGQAAEMRGEPNAVGIPTKWRPSRTEWDFFRNQHWYEYPDIRASIDAAFNRIEAALRAGKSIVFPQAGIGTGLAELPVRAPVIFAHLQKRMARLFDLADGRAPAEGEA
jgi:hypothetical protein